MARAYMNTPGPSQGELVIKEQFPNCIEVFFIPPEEKLVQSKLDPADQRAGSFYHDISDQYAWRSHGLSEAEI